MVPTPTRINRANWWTTGTFLNQMSIDPNNGGAFGLAVNNVQWETIQLSAVDDNANRLNIWTTVVQ